MRKNAKQENTNYGHLSRSECILRVDREGQWITNAQRKLIHRHTANAQSHGTQRQISRVILAKLISELCDVNDTV